MLNRTLTTCLLILVTQFGAVIHAQTAPPASRFLQFVAGEHEWQGELQTAIVSYRNAAGVEVDLVAAVHLGDVEYYQALNEYFSSRDQVLFELVTETSDFSSLQNGGQSGGGSTLGFLQQTLASLLGLSFQLEQIDYSVSNFRHADLTPTQLREIMQRKNENFFTMFFTLALAQMAEEQSRNPNGESLPALNMIAILNAFNADNRQAAFKFLFAEEIARSGSLLVGPELEQQLTILGDRNAVVLNVLQDTLADSRIKKISIFYGAAHMAGIEREMNSMLGFSKVAQQWQTAWSIP